MRFKVTFKQYRYEGTWEAVVDVANAEDAQNLVEKRAPGVAMQVDSARRSQQIVRKVEEVK